MSRKIHDRGGILNQPYRHWDLKRQILCFIARPDEVRVSFTDFVIQVMKDTHEYLHDPNIITRIFQNSDKWNTGTRPSNPEAHLFFSRIGWFLGVPEDVYPETLINCDIDAFVSYIPNPSTQRRARARLDYLRRQDNDEAMSFVGPDLREAQVVKGLESDHDANAHGGINNPHRATSFNDRVERIYNISTHDTGSVETIRSGLKNNRIDEKHYYMDPDSANDWYDLITDAAYPSYDHCRLALGRLVSSNDWIRSIKRTQPSTVVMLAGGGAPSKDRVILDALLRQVPAKHLLYCIADISFYMLMSSKRALERMCRSEGIDQRVTIEVLHRDILSMPKKDGEQFHRGGTVLFGITAGTIGNLSEEEFFRSLNGISGVDDLLVLTADTIDDLSEPEKEKLKERYDNPALRRWLKPVIYAVLNEMQVKATLSEVLNGDHIDVSLEDGIESKASNVPGSRSVVVRLKFGKRPILLTSTRYKSTQLEEFARARGWEPVCQVSTTLNPHFKQFLFCRKK